MTAPRAAVQHMLDSSILLTELGFDSVWAANSVDSPPQNRFIVVRWEDTQAAFGLRGPTSLQIWFHDVDRDYTAIDRAVEVTKDLLVGAVHVDGVDGVTLTSCRWSDDSEDLFDDGYGTVTRWASFSALGRRSG